MVHGSGSDGDGDFIMSEEFFFVYQYSSLEKKCHRIFKCDGSSSKENWVWY